MKFISSYRAGIIFALAAACGLGAITTQAKIIYADGGNALTVMLIRYLFSTLAFGVLVIVRGEGFRIARAQFAGVLSLGLVWSGAMICYLLSVETISVSLAVLILYTYPLLVLVYTICRGHLEPSPALIGLFVLAFAGLYLALSGGEMRISALGATYAGVAAVGAAYTFVCGARVAPLVSPLVMTFWINAVGLVLILPLMGENFAWPGQLAGISALTLATLFYIFAILSQFQALARLPAATAAFILNLEPVVSILLAALVLNEILSLTQWSGVIMVIAAIIISMRFNAMAKKTSA